MKKYRFSIQAICSIIVLLFTISIAAADNYSSTIKIFNKSPQVQPYFENAYGYAVFPTVGKGGLVIGGAYGKGQVYHDGKVTGTTTLTKVSIGFQAGGQAFSQIIFFEDKRAYAEFTSGQFAFDAQASAVAITAGAQAQKSSWICCQKVWASCLSSKQAMVSATSASRASRRSCIMATELEPMIKPRVGLPALRLVRH